MTVNESTLKLVMIAIAGLRIGSEPGAVATGSETQLDRRIQPFCRPLRGLGILREAIPGLRSLTFAHPGLNSVAASRLVDRGHHIELM